jgi:hypothetical protein
VCANNEKRTVHREHSLFQSVHEHCGSDICRKSSAKSIFVNISSRMARSATSTYVSRVRLSHWNTEIRLVYRLSIEYSTAWLRFRLFQTTSRCIAMSRENERFSVSRKSNQSNDETSRTHPNERQPVVSLQIAWATNKGVKDRSKDYWDADHGCSYIPYSELKDMPSLSSLAEGGTIDEESIPSFLKREFAFRRRVRSSIQ